MGGANNMSVDLNTKLNFKQNEWDIFLTINWGDTDSFKLYNDLDIGNTTVCSFMVYLEVITVSVALQHASKRFTP